MNKWTLLLLSALLLALPVFAACGGDDDGGDDTTGTNSGSTSNNGSANDNDDEDDEDILTGGGNSELDEKIKSLDLCPMLTDAEATEVSNKLGLGGNGIVATYTISREKDEYTDEQQSIRARAGCKWIISSNGGGQASIQIQAQEADGYETLYKPGGKKIDKLGDDAVNNAGTVYVKVGDLMLTPGENSATAEYATEILRKIVPDIK